MDLTGAYAILGIERSCGLDEAKRAYRARAQLMHPDRVTAGLRADAQQAMTQLNEAWRLVQADLAQRTARPSAATEEVRQPGPAAQATHGAGRAPFVGECDLCGWAPARPINLGRITGMIVAWTRRRGELELCRLCADAFYTETQAHCLTKGWWGAIAPIANIYTLGDNWRAIRQHRAQVPWGQRRDPNLITPLDAPMPFIRLRSRPAPILATLAASVIALFLLAGSLTGSPETPTAGGNADLAGTCLTEGGRQISCDDSLAVFRLSGEVGTPDLCPADAFQDKETQKWYCAQRTH